MIRRPPRSTQSRSSAASDVYKRQTSLGLLSDKRAARAGSGQVPHCRQERTLSPIPAGATTRSKNSPVISLKTGFSISAKPLTCLLYTSDAADDLLCVDLGG